MDSTANMLALPIEIERGDSTAATWTLPIEPLRFDPTFAYDPVRNQYDSTRLLERLSRGSVALTEVDLYIPILAFVFGEAELGGRRAIVSTHRLRQEFYGLPPDPKLLEERTIKEAAHEWGHALGLRHCRRYDCVMHASQSVDQIDVKSERFCPECSRRLTMRRP